MPWPGSAVVALRTAVEPARGGGTDLLVFSMRWGSNMVPRPRSHFREFAHAVMDLGVDVYFGHSAHIFQGIEVYPGRPIVYGADDFVDDYAVDPLLRNDQSLLYRLEATPSSLERLELSPVLSGHYQVNLATGAAFDQIVRPLQALSLEMVTEVQTRRPAGGGA